MTKSILFGILILAFSCQSANENKKPIVINSTLDPELESEFRKKDLKTLYPKLLTPQNFDAERDTILVRKIKAFQNELMNGLKSEKINWNVAESEISVLTRIYFDSIGRIEYFTFKVDNENVNKQAMEEFKSRLEKNINNLDLGIRRQTKYNHCVNFKLKSEK
ncbi:hypothetical protein [Thalassobellus citreus]|uniref:hypothetical protein n=1 Tax=Thalassobellus citreus TaxID=3367752 RepID=UPI0037A286B7